MGVSFTASGLSFFTCKDEDFLSVGLQRAEGVGHEEAASSASGPWQASSAWQLLVTESPTPFLAFTIPHCFAGTKKQTSLTARMCR